LERELAEAKAKQVAASQNADANLERIMQLRAEMERLKAELAPLREIVGVRCDAESCPSDITNWMNLVSHADAAKVLKAEVERLKGDQKIYNADFHAMLDTAGAPTGDSSNGHPMGATPRSRAVMLISQLRAHVAELELDKARLEHLMSGGKVVVENMVCALWYKPTRAEIDAAMNHPTAQQMRESDGKVGIEIPYMKGSS
jgi:uncharacterized small protein (DUF1192 family)